MKVLFIFDRVCHYHIPTFRALHATLQDDGHELYLLSGRPARTDAGRVGTDERVLQNERHYYFYEYKIASFTLRRWSGVTEHFNAIKPDIVIMPSHVGNISSWKIQGMAKTKNAKTVAWQCGYEYHDSVAKSLLLRIYLNRFFFHLAYHTNAMHYVMHHGVPKSKIKVIHNTIDESAIELLDKRTARETVLKNTPQIGDKLIILFVGAILEEKNIELIFEALDILNDSNIVFLVIGDGPYLNTLKESANGRPDVLFLGKIVEDVGPYFDAADLFILPGTGGLAINEAMAHSLPIISAFADGSADDLVVDNKNGFRLREHCPDILAKQIGMIMGDHGMRQKMGVQSREMITGHLSFRRFIERVSSTLNSLDY